MSSIAAHIRAAGLALLVAVLALAGPVTSSPRQTAPGVAPPAGPIASGALAPAVRLRPPSAAISAVTPTDVDVAAHLGRSGVIPESSAWEPTGNFRMICEFSHLAYDDPIVAPGQPGRSHLHMFFGNRAAGGTSTYVSLASTGDGSCQGGPVNRSAYWAPAVFDAQGRVVVPEYISVYYKGPGYAPDGRQVPVQSLPAGLRMIAGADPADHAAPSAHQWYCERTQQKSATIPSCPSGELVGVQLAFPACWNGRDLDSADHRSHLAYLRYDNGVRACPASHPVPLPEFTLGIWFQHEGDSASWYLASDRMPGMPVHPNGSSFHSDWFGAWHPAVQQTWIERCINGLLNCSGGQLGDGTELAAATDYVGPRRLAPPARP